MQEWKWKLLRRPHGLYSPRNSPGQNTGVGSLSLLQGIFPTQGSNPGLQHCRQILYQLSHKGRPRKLEWVAYPFSSRSSRPRNLTRSPPPQADSLPAESPGKPTSAGGMGLIPGSGRFPGGGNGNPLQYSFLENPMDTGDVGCGTQSMGMQRVRHDWSD